MGIEIYCFWINNWISYITLKDVNENDIGEILQFPDCQYVDSLYEDIGNYLDEHYPLHDDY